MDVGKETIKTQGCELLLDALRLIIVIIIHLNSILLYFHANSTALGPITK
jgi:hypothetical protein